MKTGKKVLSLVLVVIMCLSIVPMADLGIEASALTWGDYVYTVLDDGTVEITDYTGSATDLTIPAVIDGKTVTRIGSTAFYYCNTLVRVTIPEGVTHIGSQAFFECTSLTNITIPDSVTNISYSVFENSAYYNNKDNWTDGLLIINDWVVAFRTDCVRVPANVQNIAVEVFNTDIPIVKCFEVDSDSKYFSVDKYGVLYNKDKTKLIAYPNASKNEKFVIPETVESAHIKSYYLETLIIPDSIKEIEAISYSFRDVYFYGEDTKIINAEYGFCHLPIDQKKWFEVREKFQKLCEEYVAYYVNDTLTEEQSDEFNNELLELDTFYLDDEVPLGTIYCYPGSTAEAYAKSKGINCEYIVDDTKIKDETTGITAVFAPETFGADVDMIIEESSKNADIAFKKLFDTYKSYDISFISNGVEVQPNGKVTIKIPVSFITDINAIKVYHVDDAGNATLINSNYENGFVVFETDHFSEYVIVDESSKIEEPIVPDEPTVPEEPSDSTDNCSCNCHAGGIKAFFFKLLNFFQKLFGMNKVCACGVKH